MKSFQKLSSKGIMLKMPCNDNTVEGFVVMAMAEVDKHEAQINALLFALQAVRAHVPSKAARNYVNDVCEQHAKAAMYKQRGFGKRYNGPPKKKTKS